MAIVILKNFKPTSAGIRWKRRILNLTHKNKSNRSIFIASKWSAGRTHMGKISDRGKKSRLHKKKTLLLSPNFTLIMRFYVKNRYISAAHNKNYWVVESTSGKVSLLPDTCTITAGRIFYDTARIRQVNAQCGVGILINLSIVPFFCKITNITLEPYEKYVYATSSGVYGIKLRGTKKEKNFKIELPSGYYRFVPTTSKAILGTSSQFWVNKQVIGKAGIRSNLGYSSKVRGIAMNSVDHPHGGKANSVQPEKSPWGWVTKYSH